VNRTDGGFRKGEPRIVRLFSGLLRPKRQILGNELAGVIEAVGADVTRFKVGERVCGYTGDDFGAHAEYVCLPADAALVTTPRDMPDDEACTIWDGPWLGLTCLRAAGVQRGTQLLIYGASGSIGTSAVQLAKHLGAHVTAVCTTKNLALVASLGADEVVDYTQTDFTKLGRMFDVVLDAVGKSTFGACKHLLKPGALYMSTDLGDWWQNPRLQLWTRLVGGKRVMLAFPDQKQARHDLQHLKELFEAKILRPVIDRTYPFADIIEAHRYVDTEQKTGSVVIQIAH
jgi:NADPH:quinone reductase-like Zn-dependent oxidoreductase